MFSVKKNCQKRFYSCVLIPDLIRILTLSGVLVVFVFVRRLNLSFYITLLFILSSHVQQITALDLKQCPRMRTRHVEVAYSCCRGIEALFIFNL